MAVVGIRGLWIISLTSAAQYDVVFYRKYNCVERRAQKLYGNDYKSIPENKQLLTNLLFELNLLPGSQKFQKHRDTCEKLVQVPIINLKVPGGYLWPFIVIEQSGCLYCCLPFVDDTLKLENKKLADIPSISVGFALLTGISDFYGNQNAEVQQKLMELGNVLTICMPFGSPTETDLQTLQPLLQAKSLAIPKQNQKQAVWRPTSFKGKSSLQIQISESVRSIQHENRYTKDETNVYGSLFCKAEFDGSMAYNVSVTLGPHNSYSKLNIDNTVFHPCIQPSESGLAEHGTSFKLKFSPPLHRIKLLDFTVPVESGPPISGTYKLQGNEIVNLQLQLTLNDNLKNSFEYFEARLPFFNRGKIHHADCKPTSGSVKVSNDQRTLTWNIGQKFPSKAAKISLSAVVQFMECNANEDTKQDPFCTGLNAYAQLNFKVNDFSYSGCQVDQKYVQTTPITKFKFFYTTDLISSDYKIWNVYGESPLTAE